MSTANTPEVQITFDSGDTTIVKVTGYFTAAVNSNNLIVQANTLLYANGSRPCVLSVRNIQYAAAFANGYAQLSWVGNAAASVANSDILILGGRTSSIFQCYIPNPLAANSANLAGGGGDIGLTIQGAEPLDSYSFVITLNKEGQAGGGYANVYNYYNDSSFGQPTSPI